MKVVFYDDAPDDLLKYAVIIAKTDGKWVFCKHWERETYEVPGGHREAGETILEAAKRELYEETGAIEYTIQQIGIYSVLGREGLNREYHGQEVCGMLYYAEITEFEPELHSEIESLFITDELVSNWTYPEIQPRLLEEAGRRGFI